MSRLGLKGVIQQAFPRKIKENRGKELKKTVARDGD